MKKRLEAELISIAHRVLKLKNKSEIDTLYLETQKLYHVLGVLKFYNDNIDVTKKTISKGELEKLLVIEDEKVEENLVIADIEIPSPEIEKEAEINEVVEEEKILVENIDVEENPLELKAEVGFDFEPSEDFLVKTEDDTKEIASDEKQQFSFENLLGNDYVEPVFVKPNDKPIPEIKNVVEEKSGSINEKIAAGISVGLNDRIGFVNNLFNGSNEDYNRVISQLNTFDSLQEAKDFIEDFVKPDYKNWEGVEDYVERFLEIVEKKFE